MQSTRKIRPLDYTNLTVKQTVHTMRTHIKTQFFVLMISDFPDKKIFWQRFMNVMYQYVGEREISKWFLKVERLYRDHCNQLTWIPRDWERILIFTDAMAEILMECDQAVQFYQQKQQIQGSNDLRMTIIMDIIPESSFDYLERVGAIALLCDRSVVDRLGLQHGITSPLPA